MNAELEIAARQIAASCGYSYVRPVGEGAFKETYEVTEGNERHALKVFKPGSRAERVQREIEAMLRCDHPNIARLRRVETMPVAGAGEYMFTVEEFLGGGTLGNRLERGVLTPKEALSLGAALIDAIGHIADRDLVHRDLKLENIMLRAGGTTPVIVDFGLVRTLKATSLTKSWQPRGPGTPFFAPPEQLCNEKSLIDWRADQFALGVTLSMAVFAKHPYQLPTDASASDVVDRVALRAAGPPDTFRDAASAAGLSVLVKMVSPWPVQRHRTPDELSAAWRAQEGA